MALRLMTQTSKPATMQAIVAEAVNAIDGAEHASLTVRRSVRGHFQTLAATSELAAEIDTIQYRTGSGPCLTVITDHHVAVTDNVAVDPRWPEFARRVTDETPVVSVLARRLEPEDESLAALNLYSTAPAAFAGVDDTLLNSLITLSAIAMVKADAESDRVNLQAALNSSRRIGAAIGVLMVTYKVQYDEAFTYLRVASQHRHRHLKLTVVAEEVLETGELRLPS